MDVAIMENSGSNNHCDDGWHDSIERLHRALEPEVPRRAVKDGFEVLWQKWWRDDDTIDVESMALYLNITTEQAEKIVQHYESHKLCTKFKIHKR